jgi:hypothetical protein
VLNLTAVVSLSFEQEESRLAPQMRMVASTVNRFFIIVVFY